MMEIYLDNIVLLIGLKGTRIAVWLYIINVIIILIKYYYNINPTKSKKILPSAHTYLPTYNFLVLWFNNNYYYDKLLGTLTDCLYNIQTIC